MAKKERSLAARGAAAVAENEGASGGRPWLRSSVFAQARLIFFLFPAVVMTPWTLFQRKLLSPELARPIGRLYFWPTLPLTLFRSWWIGQGLWCELDETTLLGSSPVALLGHPLQLHLSGVRGVVNMQDEYAGPEEEYARLGIEQLWLPTLDHVEPRIEDLKAAVFFIDKFRHRGERVYVHCKAGHGRGAAAAFAWLAYSREVSGDEDLRQLNDEILTKRKVRKSLHEQPNIRAVAEWIGEGCPKPLPWEQELPEYPQTPSRAPPQDQEQADPEPQQEQQELQGDRGAEQQEL